jgi:hypothetical protein
MPAIARYRAGDGGPVVPLLQVFGRPPMRPGRFGERPATTTASPAGARDSVQRLGDLVVHPPLVVIGFWAVLVAVLSLTFGPLTRMVQERPVDILSANAP